MKITHSCCEGEIVMRHQQEQKLNVGTGAKVGILMVGGAPKAGGILKVGSAPKIDGAVKEAKRPKSKMTAPEGCCSIQ